MSKRLIALIGALAFIAAHPRALAQTAGDVTGLYYTGQNSTGGLQNAGGQDANWQVTYASTNGGSTQNTAYQSIIANSGASTNGAYVISASTISGSGYTPNTTSAQWITAPGALETNNPVNPTTNPVNAGGDFLPGNGNTGSNEGVYVYTLAFTIWGTGTANTGYAGSSAANVGTTVTNNIQITMTLAADDQYSVYVNPTGNGTTLPTGTAAASQTSAWSNKTQITLQNYGTGGADNAKFVIGVNYLVVVVDNTNSVTGSSTSTALNASGLLVYQTSDALVGGKPVPEVATWLPLAGAIGCFALVRFRRSRSGPEPAA